MKNIAVLDNSWGDCGKGRIAHEFSKNHKWVIRFNGSENCGHVIYRNNKKYVHHYLPSADYSIPEQKSFLGSGMVINPETLYLEIKKASEDFPNAPASMYIDTSAFVITQDHINFDKEKNKHIGSTGKGVGPAFTDKAARKGTRLYHLINDNAEIIKKLKDLGVNFVKFLELKEDFEKTSCVFEGAQSMLLDINMGPEYPYVTSCDTTVSAIYSCGFNTIKLDKVYGVMKPYFTKVGNGNLPTEIFGEEAEKLQKLGGEVGSTTGRTRRVGYLDLVAAKYGTIRGGINSLIVTKMDILNNYGKIKVCNSYGKDVFGPEDFIDAKPEYIEFEGWQDKNSIEAEKFCEYIEKYIGVPVEITSWGVNSEDLLWRK